METLVEVGEKGEMGAEGFAVLIFFCCVLTAAICWDFTTPVTKGGSLPDALSAADFAEDLGGGGRKSYDLGDFLYHEKLSAGLGDDVKCVGHFGGFFRVGCPPCCLSDDAHWQGSLACTLGR